MFDADTRSARLGGAGRDPQFHGGVMRVLLGTRGRRVVCGVLLMLAFAAVGLITSAWWASSASAPQSLATHRASPINMRALNALIHPRTHAVDRYTTIVAEAHKTGERVAVYHRPGAHAYAHLAPLPYSYGAPLVFLVKHRRSAWLKVQLPIRPNKSTAWIHTSAVTLATTRYHLSVVLDTHRLTVWNGAHQVLSTKVGVGRAVTPTPSGRYFLAYLLRPTSPDSVYGAYAFGLSAYSDVYSSFAGGDGEIGLHGTNDPAAIGTDVSHGCIRTYNRVITKLAHMLSLGTPITIARTQAHTPHSATRPKRSGQVGGRHPSRTS